MRTTRTRTRARRVVAAAVLSLAVLAAGCSGGDDSGLDTSADGGGADVDAGEEPAPGAVDDDTVDDGAARGDATESGGAGSGENAPGEAESDEATIETGSAAEGLQLIREVTVRLASDEPEATVGAIRRAAAESGGFVAGEDLHRRDGILQGTVTVRVPADDLQGALDRIEVAGSEVVDRQLSSQDVTLEVADVASQLRNLRALETELLDLLGDARESGDTEQVLHVFDRVRGVRDEIERLDGRRATLADRVALATITVHVEPTVDLLAATAPERDPDPEPWSPGHRASQAWQATVEGLQTLASVAIVVAVTVLPLLLVWIVPLGAIVLAGRAFWRRRQSSATSSHAEGPSATQPVGAGSVPSAPDVDED